MCSVVRIKQAYLTKPISRRPRRTYCNKGSTECFLKSQHGMKLSQKVEKYCDEVLSNNHRWSELPYLLSAHASYSDRVWSDRDIVGLDKIVKYHEELFFKYPDYSVHIDSILGNENDQALAVHFTARATCNPHTKECSDHRSIMSGVMIFMFDSSTMIKEIIVYRQGTAEERELLQPI